MNFEIATAELLKIINPFKDGIYYNNQHIIIEQEKLYEYVEQPKMNNLFSITNDVIDNFYKDIALYIINEDESTLIFIDLDNSHFFEKDKGLFEYIKNIYLQQEKSYIRFPQIGDNLLLLQNNGISRLQPNLLIKDSQDIHYATAASIFLTEPLLNKKTKGQITWQQMDSDRYSDISYVVNKIADLFDLFKPEDKDIVNNFNNLFKKIPSHILQSEEFKISLSNVNNDNLQKFLVERYVQQFSYGELKTDTFYFIDFSNSIFQQEILKQIESNNFSLLTALFNSTLDRNNAADYEIRMKIRKNIQFFSLLNNPSTIQYLTNLPYREHSLLRDARHVFSIVSVYSYLSNEYRTNTDVVKKYLSLITSRNYINDSSLFSLCPSAFGNSFLLEATIIGISDFSKLKNHLKNTLESNTLLNDKSFLLSMVNKVSNLKIGNFINYFYDLSMVDKNLISSIVALKPSFFNYLRDTSYLEFRKFYNDPDILILAVDNDFPLSDLSKPLLNSLLTKDHDEIMELKKLKYLLNDGCIDKLEAFEFEPNDFLKIREKYFKPEYMFYKTNQFMRTAHRGQYLTSFKTEEEILTLLDNIKHQNISYPFLSDSFYYFLPLPLKKCKKIVLSLLELGNLSYSSLESCVAYNCDVAIACIKKDINNINDIPHPLFTHAKFAIPFARMMDENVIDKNLLPSFVSKFFENQGITEKFEEHLFYVGLHNDLHDSSDTKKIKKSKI